MSQATFASKESKATASQSKAAAKSASGGLRIGEANDAFEREADRVADEVMAGGSLRRDWSFSRMSVGPPLQRKCACGGSGGCDACKEEEKKGTVQQESAGRFFAGKAPAIMREVLNYPGQPLDQSTRLAMRTQLGFDFSHVRVHTDDSADRAAVALGVPAYTWGKDVGFAKGAYTGFAGGTRLLAHELAHVVQQQLGETRSLAGGRNLGERARLERQAETTAHSVVAANRLPQKSAMGAPVAVLQGFDPQYHEAAVIEGLSGTFTPEETGKIYEANWRRDYSQASPALADIAMVWKQLKDATTPTDKLRLQMRLAGQIAGVVGNPGSLGGETYGGYQTWEHMDNPGDPAAAEADARWSSQGSGIAGYIRDSRAYIKQNLAQAVGIARQKSNPPDEGFGRRMADAWAGGTPPPDYDIASPYAGRVRPPQEFGSPKNVPDPKESSSVVASDVTAIAQKKTNATAKPTRGFTDDPQIADDLGRASHALEDFFAHSNFVELSQKQKGGNPVGAKDLKTGTFGGGDKAHSLADKIRGIVTEIRGHRDLIPETVLPDGLLDKFLKVANDLEAVATITTGPSSHTALNKDEPTRPGFAKAHQLAVAADHLVFESIHRAMQASLPEASSQIVYDTYALVDSLVNIPSDSHPLKALFGP
jgi:hypothetical protein